MNFRKFLLLINVLCIMGLVLGISSSVFATPTVDGQVTVLDGYTSGGNIDFTNNHDKPADTVTGEYWYWQDSDYDLFMAFALPLDYVDNSYGDNTVGDYGGKDGKHKLDQLYNSDDALFVFDDYGIEFKIDYASKDSANYLQAYASDGHIGKVLQVASSLQWDYGQYKISYPAGFDDGKNSSSPSTAGPDSYVVTQSGLENWAFTYLYEFEVDLVNDPSSAFLPSNAPVISGHVSPHKDAAPVPEPATMLLLGSGLIGLVGFGRKKLKKKL